ncbi:putative bifunctional diguanylate cyclase/phosphodiesterase [Alteromonas sp. H39]|uniref:putative bifunctional diguanylate cyclase/phosphodiesterase n=1 Tax=Alteromonas sp. H39 TaxID=3389876 RepID=UPI0039E0ADC5
MPNTTSSAPPAPPNLLNMDGLQEVRRYRLMQICSATAIGLLASLLVARGITFYLFVAGLCCLGVALLLAFKHKTSASAYTLLGSMSAMLFAFAITGAGMFDLAILGYPGMFIFAALLGGVWLFISVLLFVIALCIAIVWLTLNGIVDPNIPVLSWTHLLFILVIFIVTGFSVYILVRDIKTLMHSLQTENIKVQHSRAQIQHLAHHDVLTDLPNRLYGEKLFNQLHDECAQQNRQLAVLFIDLDNFKPVNDALGHEAGDRLLELLSKRLSQQLGPDQHLIRFGGDEFLLLAPVYDSFRDVHLLATSIIELCASEFIIMQTRIVISASIGIAVAPQHGSQFKQLCRRADIAMYEAKKVGRKTYHFYVAEMDQGSEDKFTLFQQLHQAVASRQFALYYQPIVNLATGKTVAVEALLRWPQPDGSMISPDEFIPLAESSGVITELGKWVIEQACVFCAQQRKSKLPELRVAVNLSVVQFADGKLQQTVESALKHANLPANALELELTESQLLDDKDQIQTQLKSLDRLGVSVAIDDFGTGYSNLGYLRHFNARKLKIDRSFVNALTTDPDNEEIVKAIITMAASLGLETVAEGIEDEATLSKLIALGCNAGQGYYWSKPLPGPEFSA